MSYPGFAPEGVAITPSDIAPERVTYCAQCPDGCGQDVEWASVRGSEYGDRLTFEIEACGRTESEAA